MADERMRWPYRIIIPFHTEKYKNLLNTFPPGGSVRPLYIDADFLVLAKPAGVETTAGADGRDFLQEARAALAEDGLRAVHRLDRDTSGALVVARNGAAEQALAAMFRKRLVEKIYLALCVGSPRNRQGVIRRRLSEWSGGRRPVRVVKGGGGLEAETWYRVLGESGMFAAAGAAASEKSGGAGRHGENNADADNGFRVGLLAFSPHQGRTHQIRVHAEALGHGILGDDQYGQRPVNKAARAMWGLGRQALHAWRVEFEWKGGRVRVTCPPPEDLVLALSGAFGQGGWQGLLAMGETD